MISWIDADAYARWRGSVCRRSSSGSGGLGPKGRTCRGETAGIPSRANTGKGETGTVDVGSFPGDVSQLGVLDLAGNVSEWTTDWYQPYPGNTKSEKEYGKKYKVLRGGSAMLE